MVTEVEHANSRIKICHRMFLRSENPLWVWAAYRAWAAIDALESTPLPDWIRLHFCDIDRALQVFGFSGARASRSTKSKARWKTATLRAFGFPRDPFVDYERSGRALNLAIAVRILVDIPIPHKHTEAYRLVAERVGVSIPSVRRAWKTYRAVARLEDLDEQIRWRQAAEDLETKHPRFFGQVGQTRTTKARKQRSNVTAFRR